jgi:hypothetical protein
MKRLEYPHEIVRKHRMELLGAQIIAEAPPEFWKLSAREKLKISPEQWENLSFDLRGKMIAYVQLSNMAEVLRMDAQLLERNKRAELARNKP